MSLRHAFVLLFCLLLFISNVSAQQKSGLAYQKCQSVLMAGYGIGNIWKSFLKDAIDGAIPGITYKVTATGPLALTYEYGFHKRISGGVTVAYSQVKGKYSGYGDSFVDKLTIFTALARANYHFGEWKEWDLYAGGGLGYVHSKYANDQSATRNDVPGELGYTLQGGARYYFSTNWGAFAELGYLNGSFGQVGISVKF